MVILGVLTVVGLRIAHKLAEEPPLSLAQIQQREGIPVEVVEVRPDSITSFLAVTGVVGSEEEAYLSSKMGGRISKIYKDIGDTVKKGEKLVDIDTSQLEIQKTQAENQLRIAERSLNQVRIRLEDARKDLERIQNLFRKKAISKKELERFELKFQTVEQQYETALAQLEVARDNLMIIETNIRDSSVFAPFDGIVGTKKAEAGEIVAPGQVILSLYNLAKLNAQVQVAESDLVHLKVGQEVEVKLDAFPEERFKGKVLKISGAPDPNTRRFDVHIAFEKVPSGIKAGFFLQAEILTGKRENILTIPIQALIKEVSPALKVDRQASSAEGLEYFVFIVKNDRAKKQRVELGERIEEKVEIISGIETGDRVITFGKENVTAGSLVKIIERK